MKTMTGLGNSDSSNFFSLVGEITLDRDKCPRCGERSLVLASMTRVEKEDFVNGEWVPYDCSSRWKYHVYIHSVYCQRGSCEFDHTLAREKGCEICGEPNYPGSALCKQCAVDEWRRMHGKERII